MTDWILIVSAQILDEIRNHMMQNVANFDLVPEKIFNLRLNKKFNNHKQTLRSGKKGTSPPCTFLELGFAPADWLY